MKYKLMVFILALTVASWAQTATQTAPAAAAPQQSTKAAEKTACPCCDQTASAETAETKDAHSCCAHHDMAANNGKGPACCAGMDKDKDKTSCCSGKDAKSCNRSKDKTAAACCGSEKCGKDCKKGCCASGKKAEATAMNCCQGKQATTDASAGVGK